MKTSDEVGILVAGDTVIWVHKDTTDRDLNIIYGVGGWEWW